MMAENSTENLPGELRVCHVSEVRMFLPTRTSSPVPPAVGHLICSNFRLKFLPITKEANNVTKSSLQVYFGAIQTVCSVSGSKRRVLDCRNTLPRNLEVIEIICKDFKRISFSFKNCRKNEAYSMMNAMLVYSQPQHTTLFVFDYVKELRKDELEQSAGSVTSELGPVSFLNPRDWEKELQRVGSVGYWRVCEINRSFTFSDSLPPYFVVPESVADQALYHVARQHHGNRLPVWCWSHPEHGTSIVRCSASTNSDTDKPSDMNYIWAASCGRTMKPFDLSAKCCTVKDIAASFTKLREICMPVSEHDLKNVEKRWLTLLNSSRWLELVRLCLQAAVDVKKLLCEVKSSVLLIEPDGRDVSCIVSSLVQLMCDPHCRSVIGFEMLIQKEWVAMGHPFCSRNRLVTTSCKSDDENDTSQAPVFLLFLDCVWQLTEQFPSAFAFSSVYLKQLYTCSLSNLYGTFVFDNCRDMYDIVNGVQPGGKMAIQKPLTVTDCVAYMESAWGKWTDQLSTTNDREDYLNPLYYLFSSQAKEAPQNVPSPLPIDYGFVSLVVDDEAVDEFLGGLVGLYDTPGQGIRRSHHSSTELIPNTCAACIKFWSQLYLSGIQDISQPDCHRLYVQRHQSQLVCQIRKQKDKLHMSELANGAFAFDLINHETSYQSLGSHSGGSSDLSRTSSPLPIGTTQTNSGEMPESPLAHILTLANGTAKRDTYHGDETVSQSHSPLTRSSTTTPRSSTSTPQGSRIVRGRVTIIRDKDSQKKQARHKYTASDSPPIITTKDTTIIRKAHTPTLSNSLYNVTESHYL